MEKNGVTFYGIMYSQSVMLTEIGRSLQTPVALKKIEERFCRQLKKPDIWAAIHGGRAGGQQPSPSQVSGVAFAECS